MSQRIGRRKKRSHLKPDEQYLVGPMAMERYGSTVIIENLMTEEEKEGVQQKLVESLPDIIRKIDTKVQNIESLVKACDPLDVMRCAYFAFSASIIGKESELEVSSSSFEPIKALEYLQDMIAAVPREGIEGTVPFTEDHWTTLCADIRELYLELIPLYLPAVDLSKRASGIDIEEDEYKLRALCQMVWVMIRRDNYTCHDLPILRELLQPHSTTLQRTFGISSEVLIAELKKIQTSLTRGLIDAYAVLKDLHEEFKKRIETDETPEDLGEYIACIGKDLGLEKSIDEAKGCIAGDNLFDLEIVTNLPKTLLEELSWCPGEETSFLTTGEHRGWPFRITPSRTRPFLKIGEKYYVYNQQILFDNAYRFIQRAVTRLKPEYSDTWQINQKDASEKLVKKLFSRILKGAEIHHNFRIPPLSRRKGIEWPENDLICILDDHLYIIEVKAGKYTYTSPTDDFDAHASSIRELIHKPFTQAQRFIEYLEANDEVALYSDSEERGGIEITRLSKSNFRKITACGVTLDSFTFLASKAEELRTMGAEFDGFPFWSMSISDLCVYADVFESPLAFNHYCEQRVDAISNSNFRTDDEIDQLGLYLAHNRYSTLTDNLTETMEANWVGYSEQLDRYFHSKLFEELVSPPRQEIPKRLQEILDFLDKSTKPGRARVSSIIRDLSRDLQSTLGNRIDKSLHLQERDKRIRPFSLDSSVRLTLACPQPRAPFGEEEARKYALSHMVAAIEDDRTLLVVTYNDAEQLTSVDWEFLCISELTSPEREALAREGERLTQKRIRLFREQTGQKIGRNDRCPCGSGKKYKRCHGV